MTVRLAWFIFCLCMTAFLVGCGAPPAKRSRPASPSVAAAKAAEDPAPVPDGIATAPSHTFEREGGAAVAKVAGRNEVFVLTYAGTPVGANQILRVRGIRDGKVLWTRELPSVGLAGYLVLGPNETLYVVGSYAPHARGVDRENEGRRADYYIAILARETGEVVALHEDDAATTVPGIRLIGDVALVHGDLVVAGLDSPARSLGEMADVPPKAFATRYGSDLTAKWSVEVAGVAPSLIAPAPGGNVALVGHEHGKERSTELLVAVVDETGNVRRDVTAKSRGMLRSVRAAIETPGGVHLIVETILGDETTLLLSIVPLLSEGRDSPRELPEDDALCGAFVADSGELMVVARRPRGDGGEGLIIHTMTSQQSFEADVGPLSGKCAAVAGAPSGFWLLSVVRERRPYPQSVNTTTLTFVAVP